MAAPEKREVPASENPSPPQETPRTPEPKSESEKVLFTWRAPARPFKRRGREYWITLIAIAAIFGFILFLIEGAMSVLLIISLVFLFYVLSTVEPQEIEYKITAKGIKIADSLTEWDYLPRFWFTRRLTDQVVAFEMVVLPGRLELVINPKDKELLRKAISKYIPEEEAPPSNIDKLANWASSKLPGNQ